MPLKIEGRDASLKRKIRRHLRTLGFTRNEAGLLVPPDLSKETYRAMHQRQRLEKFRENEAFIKRIGNRFNDRFADGSDIVPSKVRPRIEEVRSQTPASDLFRLSTLYWRIPVSEGYGRRMRFLVWDDSNGKLIGIFALGDAVFNLRVRDEFVGWDHHRRAAAMVNMMDAYVLGALPPYSNLLGGKLIACLTRTKEVVVAFRHRYSESTGIISGEKKDPHLVALSTTSALGRSSIYNRLALDGNKYYESIGYTSGWGHFHIPEVLFDEMRSYLKAKKDPYADLHNFGSGPNWRMRMIRKALVELGMNGDLMQHGLAREVFFCSVAENAKQILLGNNKRPQYSTLRSVAEVGELCKERWMLPRATTRPDFMAHKAEFLLRDLSGALFNGRGGRIEGVVNENRTN